MEPQSSQSPSLNPGAFIQVFWRNEQNQRTGSQSSSASAAALRSSSGSQSLSFSQTAADPQQELQWIQRRFQPSPQQHTSLDRDESKSGFMPVLNYHDYLVMPPALATPCKVAQSRSPLPNEPLLAAKKNLEIIQDARQQNSSFRKPMNPVTANYAYPLPTDSEATFRPIEMPSKENHVFISHEQQENIQYRQNEVGRCQMETDRFGAHDETRPAAETIPSHMQYQDHPSIPNNLQDEFDLDENDAEFLNDPNLEQMLSQFDQPFRHEHQHAAQYETAAPRYPSAHDYQHANFASNGFVSNGYQNHTHSNMTNQYHPSEQSHLRPSNHGSVQEAQYRNYPMQNQNVVMHQTNQLMQHGDEDDGFTLTPELESILSHYDRPA